MYLSPCGSAARRSGTGQIASAYVRRLEYAIPFKRLKRRYLIRRNYSRVLPLRSLSSFQEAR